jgi:hypothetical protein
VAAANWKLIVQVPAAPLLEPLALVPELLLAPVPPLVPVLPEPLAELLADPDVLLAELDVPPAEPDPLVPEVVLLVSPLEEASPASPAPAALTAPPQAVIASARAALSRARTDHARPPRERCAAGRCMSLSSQGRFKWRLAAAVLFPADGCPEDLPVCPARVKAEPHANLIGGLPRATGRRSGWAEQGRIRSRMAA